MPEQGYEMIPENCLRQLRRQAGLSQEDLARRAGIARQTVGGIEAGRYGPSLAVALRLARALDKEVEEIFQLSAQAPHKVIASWSGIGQVPVAGEKIQLTGSSLTPGYIAFPANRDLFQAEANAVILERSSKQIVARLLDPDSVNSPAVILAGCSPILAYLRARINNRYRDLRLYWINTNSMSSLKALKKGLVHGAGVHLYDEITGQYNLPAVKQVLASRSFVIVNLCYGEQGFLVTRGNPKKIASFGDLARQGIRLANRERGAETRRILDSGLRVEGISNDQVSGYHIRLRSHQEVAQAVALGGADCGIGPRPLARLYELDFLPLARERYDMVFLIEHMELPGVQAILEYLGKASFHQELELSGYSSEQCGQVLPDDFR
jgi:putative molybdopterin biosynthesis protein